MVEALLGLFCFLIALAVILVVVAVVGHGIWTLVAALFGAANAPLEEHAGRNRFRTCVGCGEDFFRDAERCPACGLDPASATADELKDLLATARTVQRLREAGSLRAETCEHVYRSIEARQENLLPGRSKRRAVELDGTPQTAIDVEGRFEAWFGKDLGAWMSIDDKKEALALARMLRPEHLRNLSARALLGLARLQESVGMVSRACQAYQTLLECHPTTALVKHVAGEAIRLACKLGELGDWHVADRFVRIVSDIPGLVESQPDLALLIEQVHQRDLAPVPAPPTEAPVVEIADAAPIVASPPIVESPPAPVIETTPVAPRRSLAEWIAVFMEESNILWGELIGGTLIVGCSIALVISLWQTLEQIPFFPFLIFAAITSALFGAGFYTLHHWKLESTSRGLLLIATLLAPLDFLVLAGLTRTDGAGLWDYVTAITALAAFGWFLVRSSHILIQTPLEVRAPSALLVAGAMIVSAAAQLVAPAWLSAQDWSDGAVYVLTLLPVFAQVGAMGWILWRLAGVETWNVGRLAALLIALGSVTFACSVTLSFPLYAAERLGDVLPTLAPALTLLGVPILIAGTLIHRRLTMTQGEQHGLWRMLGTALALTGLLVMFGGFAAAVEQPALRWLCGMINIGTLVCVAWGFRMPALHVAAQVYLAILFVHGWRPDLDELTQTPTVALRLAGLLVLQAVLAEGLIRWQRTVDARFYAVGCAVSTVLAGVLVLPFARTSPDVAALVLGAAAVTWYGANLRWRFAEITYACSFVLAAAIFFAFRHYYLDATFSERLLGSLLTHATICLLASAALRFVNIDWLTAYYRIPLQFASLAATFVAAAVVFVEQYHGSLTWTTSCAACCWLAALWVTVSILEGWAALFGAFQIALGAAWIFGAGAWLTAHGWDWREPYSLHTYALGLGALSLLWELARIKARPLAAALLSPAFVPVDRVITGALIVGQYALTLAIVWWSIGKELSAAPAVWRILPAAWHADAYTLAAWLLPALLALVLILWLRDLDVKLPALGFTLLALAIPLLIAGGCFDASLASASAARWGLAWCYGLGSLALWQRHRLGERADRIPVIAIRGLMLAGAIMPVLLITSIVTLTKLGGRGLPGPLDDTIFITMTGPVSLLVPLALLSAALAGHGFRERLDYYLLAAGLLANTSSIGGFFLGLQMNRIALGESWIVVDALLLAAGVAWLWSIVWTWIASLLERDDARPLLDSPLLTLNNLFGTASFAVILITAVSWIGFGSAESGRQWTHAAGAPWSWLAFALLASGAAFHSWKRRGTLPLHLIGALSLTAVGVIACSVESVWRDQGFVTLMFLCGVFACGWVWSNLFLDAQQQPRWLTFQHGLPETPLYAGLAGAAAVLLGCMGFADAVWSAESIVLTALACGLLAYQRRTEIWASLATMVLMIAGTILTLHFAADDPHLALLTIHLNLAVLGAAALARLALHRFLTAPDVEISHVWHLPVQIGLGMLANGVLLLFALAALAFVPDHPGRWVQQQATWAGWLALLTNAIALTWYVARVRPTSVVHAVTVAGLMLGLVAAGTFDSIIDDVPWLAHHVLTLSWTLLALGLLIVSWASHAQTGLGPAFWPAERRTRLADVLRRCFPEATTRGWVTLCGAFVVVLALRATWVEPARPYWSVGNTLAVSVLLGSLAVWSRSAIYVYGSGLLINVIGLLLFTAWSAHRLDARGPMLGNDEWFSYLVLAQILSFGVAAIVWSLLEWKLRERLGGSLALPFAQAAIFAGIQLLAIGVGFANGLHLCGESVRIGSTLAWVALGVLAAAVVCERWRPEFRRLTAFHFYTCGLLALGLLLHGLSLSIADWYWTATLLLAGYVLLVVALLRVTQSQDHTWLWPVQLGIIGLVLVLAMWITLTYATWHARLGGALASSLVTLAAYLLLQAWPRVFPDEAAPTSIDLHHRLLPCHVVLTLGIVVALEACWALLDAPAVWLQRNAAALAIVGAAALAYRFLFAHLLGESRWTEASRSLAAVLGVVAGITLVLLLGQELVTYNADLNVRSTPLRKELVAFAGLGIVGLIGLAMHSALTTETDPYGVEGSKRSLYVYLTELLALALLTHVRLNLPDYLPRVLGQFWYLAVMALAFAGLALSEIITRKELSVLVIPLKRSAMLLAFLPVLAFRLGPLAAYAGPVKQLVPGVDPFLKYLQGLSELFLMEALCWLLLGVFFSWLARLRKSANYGILAALAVNAGLWVLLGHQDATAFLQRPQLWLIPLGLIVLVAEAVNRDRVGFWPSLSVRYVGLLCIYLSSTIEMLRELIHSDPIYPIVLAVLAVIGMLVGILLQVRAFLLSGFLALLVVVFAQIWNAAVFHSHTWVWWASGIILGAIILAMFALFEKHRNDVLKLLDNMKRWS